MGGHQSCRSPLTAEGAVVTPRDCTHIAPSTQESYIDVGGTGLVGMHAWHARSRSHRDSTAVHVNLVLSKLGVGSSTLEGEHTMRSPALDLTPEPNCAASSRYRRPDGQVCSA
ncbi:hypothetical protein VTO73DRAFT_14499 [Trametes versicolor]